MRSCRRCGCLCDPGDLISGVCDDCWEEEEQLEIRAELEDAGTLCGRAVGRTTGNEIRRQ